MKVWKDFTFEAAHRLTKMPPGHKCERLHGHSFRVRIVADGPVDESGIVVDFGRIRAAFDTILARLDHRYLNEIEGLENPTSENIAIWIWSKLKPRLPLLAEVHVFETCSCCAVYAGGE